MVVERPAVSDLNRDGTVSLDELLQWVVDANASDLHLVSEAAPCARVLGSLAPIPGTGVISTSRLERMLLAIMNDRQRNQFHETSTNSAVKTIRASSVRL